MSGFSLMNEKHGNSLYLRVIIDFTHMKWSLIILDTKVSQTIGM